MPDYHAQIARIKTKIPRARAADPRRKVFGANGHRYQLAGPVPIADLLALEQRYGISLPDDYRRFMQEIGPGAGPFYGLHNPCQHATDLVTDPRALQQPSHWKPGMSEEEWTALTLPFEPEDMSDTDFEQATDALFAGLLPLGPQGCTYYHALVVSGEHRGRVVNLDEERYLPKFAYESNFLDWYERWLDEILDGTLLSERAGWFGYRRGGTEAELLAGFRAATDPRQQREYLTGLTRLPAVSPATLDQLTQAYASPDAGISIQALQCLTQFDYARARPLLKARWLTDPLRVAQFVYWYAKKHAEDWVPEIRAVFTTANPNPKLFDFASYLAKTCRTDLAPLLQSFVNHPNPQLSRQAVYSIQQIAESRPTIWQRIRGLVK
ncbi:MAG: SMI1/KNR4 family protein [Hymenobacter sp.]|nr:MAG: SMI1/KNR4 family protein [Hymenobacter sp.]